MALRNRFLTIPQMFVQVTNRYRGNTQKPAFLRKIGSTWTPTSYDQLREITENFALGLSVLGIDRGDMVAIISENRLEWVISDFAITGMGAVDVPMYPTLTAPQEAYILNHCKAKGVVVSNKFQLNKILKVAPELTALEHIVVMNDDVDLSEATQALSTSKTLKSVSHFADIVRSGAAAKSADDRRTWFEDSVKQVQAEDLLTIIYTSGTTGNPKGVMLTNANMVANVDGSADAIPLSEKDLLLSFLPLCHAYERTTGYYTVFATEGSIAFAVSIDTVAENIREVRPTYLTAVPRLFERIRGRILGMIEKDKPAKQKIFFWAQDVGAQYLRAKEAGRISPVLRAQYALADRLVFSKLRERMGGRLVAFISGGAALPKDLGEFFIKAGIIIQEGYGLTETAPVLAVSRYEEIEVGTVGKALFNVHLKIADDGEILAKGPNVMTGYLHDPSATSEIIDSDGWLHTGDIGVINNKGNLQITDRKKSIFVSSGGKNIAPQPVENALSQSRFVDQLVLIGDKREYCTALIVPDFEYVKEFATQQGLSYPDTKTLLQSDTLLAAIQSDIEQFQRDFAKFEKVRKFSLLDKAFTVEDGEMTPKLSLRRHVIEKKYATDIEQMYGEG
jgi:long-chain acyl-CoA synthetase